MSTRSHSPNTSAPRKQGRPRQETVYVVTERFAEPGPGVPSEHEAVKSALRIVLEAIGRESNEMRGEVARAPNA
jgi:hypothetical protein